MSDREKNEKNQIQRSEFGPDSIASAGYISGLNGTAGLTRSGRSVIESMTETRALNDEYIYSLVQNVKHGDCEAFRTITQLYQRKVYLLAYSFFRNSDDAMDIVQETFLRFYQKVSMFQKGKNFQNWLLQVTKNLCIDHYRKNYKKHNEILPGIDVEDRQLGRSDDQVDSVSSDLREIFANCLAKLSERQRMIFVMKHLNQLQYSEIAQILGIAVGTVKSLNFKAIQNIRGLMVPYLGEQA